MKESPDSVRKKTVFRFLNGWWKKKRNYYVDIHQEFQSDMSSMFPEEESMGTSLALFESDDVVFDVSSTDTSPTPSQSVILTPDHKNLDRSSIQHTTPDLYQDRVITPTPFHNIKYFTSVEHKSPVMYQERPTTSASFSTPFRRSGLVYPPIPEQQEAHLDLPCANTSCSTGSLLSMDSLAHSYGDDDSDPQVTSKHNNDTFFEEHVCFLRIQTTPRPVEVVWENKQ